MNVKISVLNIYKIVSNYILFTNKLIIGIRDELIEFIHIAQNYIYVYVCIIFN